jgi:hypothetical protein
MRSSTLISIDASSLAALLEQPVKRLGLLDGPRKAVEDEPLPRPGGRCGRR